MNDLTKRKNRAIHTLDRLKMTLDNVVARDPEQEVQGIAVNALDAVVSDARSFVDEGDPVLDQVVELISAEVIEEGTPIRCVDALLVVDTLLGRLGMPEIEI